MSYYAAVCEGELFGIGATKNDAFDNACEGANTPEPETLDIVPCSEAAYDLICQEGFEAVGRLSIKWVGVTLKGEAA